MKSKICLDILMLTIQLVHGMNNQQTRPQVQRLRKEVANKPPYEVKRIAAAKLNEYTKEKSEYTIASRKVEELIKDISIFRTILKESTYNNSESKEEIIAGTDFYDKEQELEKALQELQQRRLNLDKQLPTAVYRLLKELKAGGADRN